MKAFQKFNSSLGISLLVICVSAILVGCSNPDGEGLSDQQKLDGARKAREQQMGGQGAGSNTPMTRESMPGANKP